MKNLKLTIIAIALALALVFVGCGKKDDTAKTDTKTETKTEEKTETKTEEKEEKKEEAPAEFKGAINVVSREVGSGTRGAFTEITKIITKNDKGEEVDQTTIEATIANATDAVVTTVSGDKAAIGYISLASLNDSVKALKVDGAMATPEEIVAGKYPIARPFMLAYKEAELSDLAKDFLKFCMSVEGQKIVEEDGCIPVETSESYTPAKISGTLTIAGSTSVTPLMEKLVDAYKALNPDFKADIQATGSGAGIKSATEGICDIGMSSRALKEEEEANLDDLVLARDGIAVIVNNENPIDELTVDQIRSIYTGEVSAWEEVK